MKQPHNFTLINNLYNKSIVCEWIISARFLVRHIFVTLHFADVGRITFHANLERQFCKNWYV